jgi:hypothetical protein
MHETSAPLICGGERYLHRANLTNPPSPGRFLGPSLCHHGLLVITLVYRVNKVADRYDLILEYEGIA